MPNLGMVIVVGIALLPLFVGSFLAIFLFKRSQKGRRTPLTNQLLRGPGEGLRNELEKNSEKLLDALMFMGTSCFPALVLLFVLSLLQEHHVYYWQFVVLGLVYVACIVWCVNKLIAVMIQRRKLYLGLDAEIAVGQELNQLMLHGCRVYHDFPAEEFNIDHVVVGPGGVFAVETKGRSKPDKGRGNIDAKVFYDGEALKFPDWNEKKPLTQARRQAVWLTKWLTSAVGEPVKALPVLALPGWFVERTRAGGVIVINGKSPFVLARPQGKVPLDEKLIQQISHQLEQRCRDVEPVGYKKVKKKAA